MPTLHDIALRYQILLESVKTHEALRLTKTVEKSERLFIEWSVGLAGLLLTDYTVDEFSASLTVLNESLAAAYGKGGADLLEAMGKIGEASANFQHSFFTRYAKDPAKIVESTPEDIAAAVFDTPLTVTGETATAFVDAFILAQPKSVIDYAQKARARGLSVQEMVTGLRGTKSRNYKDGLIAANRRQAEAVARTTVQSAAMDARQQMYKDNDIKEYQWISTLDTRTTAQCRSLDNQIFEVGNGPNPPLHVNCRSVTIPVLGKEFDFLDKGATRSSLTGEVDATQTYYDWLKDQSDEFQDEVLGPTRGSLFRDGGLSADRFAALNLNSDFAPRTLDEMRALEPLAFSKAGIK